MTGINKPTGPNERSQWPEKTRILLGLGVGLAIAYVLFLSVWFWRARRRIARRHVVRY